jgi:hypothetical protein
MQCFYEPLCGMECELCWLDVKWPHRSLKMVLVDINVYSLLFGKRLHCTSRAGCTMVLDSWCQLEHDSCKITHQDLRGTLKLVKQQKLSLFSQFCIAKTFSLIHFLSNCQMSPSHFNDPAFLTVNGPFCLLSLWKQTNLVFTYLDFVWRSFSDTLQWWDNILEKVKWIWFVLGFSCRCRISLCSFLAYHKVA